MPASCLFKNQNRRGNSVNGSKPKTYRNYCLRIKILLKAVFAHKIVSKSVVFLNDQAFLGDRTAKKARSDFNAEMRRFGTINQV